MKKWIPLGVMFLFLMVPTFSKAQEIKGYIRSVNYEGHSFSVDQPPLQRVWVSPETVFDRGSGDAGFQSLKEGSYAVIEGTLQSNGLFTARRISIPKISELQNNEKKVELNQTFLLEVNQTVQLKGEGLSLRGLETIDTLCKEGLQCEGEGGLGMKVLVTQGTQKQEITLISIGDRKPVPPVKQEALGYKIELIEVGESASLLVVRKK